MKVYTRAGDRGLTSLVGGERVFKTDERVEAYGTVDELSAFTALLADRLRKEKQEECAGELISVISRLMTVEALLARGESGAEQVPALAEEEVLRLEQRIDAMQAELPALDKFTVPGGHEAVSMCHVCRTVCRRAERAALRADQRYGVDPVVLAYLNRLSDYFYVLGRALSQRLGAEEILWIP